MSFEATTELLATQHAADVASLPGIEDNIENAQQNLDHWVAEKARVEARIAEHDGAYALLDGSFD